MSLNRVVFNWRLKVRMFSHSRMAAGREFQVDGAATETETEKARRTGTVCVCVQRILKLLNKILSFTHIQNTQFYSYYCLSLN